MLNLVTQLPVVRAMWSWAHARLFEIRFAPARPVLVPAGALRRGAMFALALGAVAAPVAADEYSRIRVDEPSYAEVLDGRLVDVRVLIEGESAPLYVAPGRFDGRRYVEAFAGRRYALELRNNTGRRVGVLIAVDGLNVVNGERSRLSRHEPMYVLDPWERAEIRGWRTSLDDVRRFVFVDEKRSYAERTGQANGDMGWIRVLTFNEDKPLSILPKRFRAYDGPEGEWRSQESPSEPQARDEMAPAPAAPGRESDRRAAEKLGAQANGDAGSYPGTGWGNRDHDPVQQTRFKPMANPTDRLAIRYEYASGLQALGIDPWRGRHRVYDRDRGELGFAKPPKW